MTKAEQRAFEKFPKRRVRNGYDVNKNKRVVYLMAYRQAEKDVNDAFIEKAKKWLEEHDGLYEAFDSDSRTYYTDTEAMVTDFENYMKGE